YSIKANPHPRVVRFFVSLGCGCEIASGGEYATARNSDCAIDRVVFAGPGKGAEELEFVIGEGIGEIHLESFEEIEILEQIGKRSGGHISVAIRINPASGFGGGLLMGGQATAFGFEEESLAEVVKKVRACAHLDLRGIHLYTGTQILDSEAL